MTLPLDLASAVTADTDTGPATTVAAEDTKPGNCGATAGPVLAWKSLLDDRREELKADREWASNIYRLFARGGDDEVMRYLVLPGDPWSKSRPRFTKRGKSYQPRDDREAEQRLRDFLSLSAPTAFPGNVMLACRFYRSSYQRVDTDNLLKHVCDSANGVWWADDSQVTFALGEIQHDREHPRTIILAGNHESTLPRGDDLHRSCEQCGKQFRPAPGRERMSTQRYCSRVCARVAAGFPDLSAHVPCPHCGKDFRRKTSEQKFCSWDCARASLVGRKKPRTARPSRCTQCGTTLTHNRGGRCRECWRSSPKGQPEPVQAELEISDLSPATSPARDHTKE